MECGIHSTDWKCSFQTAPLSVETVGLDAETAPTTNRQIPNCTNYYEKPAVPLVVEQLVGAPLPTLPESNYVFKVLSKSGGGEALLIAMGSGTWTSRG